jgi:hypothetical protein
MSYDLMVFLPDAAPEGREAFMTWYREITKWGEGHNYDNPQNTAPILRAWYRDMITTFPAMNGPDGVSDDHPALDSGHVAGYACARAAIYADFRWSVAQDAYNHTLMYAAVHGLGFFDVSATDGAVWLPTERGFKVAHGGAANDQKIEEALAQWIASRG